MISVIVAMDINRVIGKDGKTPWQGKLQADMLYFRDTTIGKTVVHGRKTYESIPLKFRPLPNRENIVLTRDHDFQSPSCIVIHSVEEILRIANGIEIWVIGGGEIYNLFLPHAKRLVVTHIDAEFEGDVFFPEINHKWTPHDVFDKHEVDEKNLFPFQIVEYTR